MGEKYAECQKMHTRVNGRSGKDGCQEFCINEVTMMPECDACGCHRNFHRKVEASKFTREDIYTKCLKIHDFGPRACEDGCQKFRPRGEEGTSDALICAVCGCDRDFHYNDVRFHPLS